MPECHPSGQRELVPVLVEPHLELGGGGLVSSGDVLGEELHLLRHAALDDGVVLVQTHGQGFAVQHLLADLVLHERAKLVGSRLPAPLRLEIDIHRAEVIERELNLL
jgi:hypothetical protein